MNEVRKCEIKAWFLLVLNLVRFYFLLYALKGSVTSQFFVLSPQFYFIHRMIQPENLIHPLP